MTTEPWEGAEVQVWCEHLLNSYRRWLGSDLIPRTGSRAEEAHSLFVAPFVVVSHGTQDDPVLNFGNRLALELWETTWGQFIETPSRLTAEPVNQVERTRMLQQAALDGFIDNYRGVRISMKGRRFLVDRALVWNVVDRGGHRLGQAATFKTWSFLEGVGDARPSSPRAKAP